jgi:hypothetical protein
MNATEIIMYRNPVEQAFWNIVTSAAAWPYIAGVIVALVVALVSVVITDHVNKKFRVTVLRQHQGSLVLTAAAVAAVAVIWWLS